MRTLLVAILLPVLCATHAQAGTKKGSAPKTEKTKEAIATCVGCGSDERVPAEGERFAPPPVRRSRRGVSFEQ